jgi:hypothetical protein
MLLYSGEDGRTLNAHNFSQIELLKSFGLEYAYSTRSSVADSGKISKDLNEQTNT